MADNEKLIDMKTSVGPSVVLKGVKNNVHVYFEVATGKPDQTSRPPVDLCIVLDRSGSMRSKNKMQTAKAAIKGVARSLDGSDRLSLVVYDDNAKVVFDFNQYPLGDGADLVCHAIDAVQTQGCTNLCGGLKKGFKLFEDCKTETDHTSRNKKLFLFSDGLVNRGETSESKICDVVAKAADLGITVDSFGIGDDFNEDLMQNIGEFGCGRFLFIESAEAMEQFVAFALKGILRLVARRAVLKVRGAGSSIVERVYSGDTISGFNLNDLTASNCRGVLVEISCSPSGDDTNTELAKWELIYKNEAGEEEKMTGVVNAPVTEDNEEVIKSKNTAVAVALSMRQVMDIDEKVDSLIESGRRAEAVKMKEEFLEEVGILLSVDPENAKLKSFVTSQKRAIQELKDTSSSCSKNMKINKKNRYCQRRDSVDYFMNDVCWESSKLT